MRVAVGTWHLASTVGRGTTLQVRLPLTPRAAVEAVAFGNGAPTNQLRAPTL